MQRPPLWFGGFCRQVWQQKTTWKAGEAELICLYGPSAATERFSSGRELLEGGTKADILFLDIQMPGMDGMEMFSTMPNKKKWNQERSEFLI